MQSLQRRCLKIFFITGLLFFSTLSVAEDWVLELDDEGVKLYTKDSERSPVRQFQAVTVLKAPLEGVVALLNDHGRFPRWMDNIKKSEELREISSFESLSYMVVKTPWPEPDRDNIIYSKWSQNPDTLVVTQSLMSEPQHLNKKRDHVRTEFFQAEWRLTPLDSGLVEVVYSAEIHPGAHRQRVQDWLVEMLAYEMPFKTLRNLQNVSFDRYKGASFSFLKAPSPTSEAEYSVPTLF